jgi:RpiB/LacA/LacB family sugar-phosphate isomerase
MKVAIGSDHAGFGIKQAVAEFLAATGIQVEDFGTYSTDSVDYPDYAEKVGMAVQAGEADRGVLVCGTGLGVCIAANKIHGIRAAAPWSAETARLSRLHNDSNVLCLSGRHMEKALALELLRIWLETPFEGGRHQRRVDKIAKLEEKE